MNEKECSSNSFKEAFAQIEELKKTKEIITKKYSIAENFFEISYFSSDLAQGLSPAIAHLESANKDLPALSLFVLDFHDLKNKLTLSNNHKKEEDYPTFYLYKDDRYRCLQVVDIDSTSICLLDLQEEKGIFCTSSPRKLKNYERGRPFLNILYPWLKSKNFRIIHAAAVGFDQNGLILGGVGGSGKSTTSLAAFGHGMEFGGDDYVIYSPENKGYCLYNSAMVDDDSIKRQTWLDPSSFDMKNNFSEKINLFLQQIAPQRILKEYNIKAIVLPRINQTEFSSLSNISPMQALKLLAPSTILQLCWVEQVELSDLGSLVQKVPCYQLNLGTNLTQTTALLHKILE